MSDGDEATFCTTKSPHAARRARALRRALQLVARRVCCTWETCAQVHAALLESPDGLGGERTVLTVEVAESAQAHSR